MIQTIYAEVPREKISYLTRPEFINGQEQSFHESLTDSMSKHGFKDPVYCWYGSKPYGNIIKIIVGNNRMVVAKELDIKIIPAVITNFKADESPLEGRVLKKDDEIRALFHLPKQLQIRRDKNGDIDQVMAPPFPTVKQHYV
tara:strand:- start:399 stop:824 length:426 start_codon:yes stop_codon:yes gene_type:complete